MSSHLFFMEEDFLFIQSMFTFLHHWHFYLATILHLCHDVGGCRQTFRVLSAAALYSMYVSSVCTLSKFGCVLSARLLFQDQICATLMRDQTEKDVLLHHSVWTASVCFVTSLLSLTFAGSAPDLLTRLFPFDCEGLGHSSLSHGCCCCSTWLDSDFSWETVKCAGVTGGCWNTAFLPLKSRARLVQNRWDGPNREAVHPHGSSDSVKLASFHKSEKVKNIRGQCFCFESILLLFCLRRDKRVLCV